MTQRKATVTVIGGVPATGKTTVMKKFLTQRSGWSPVHFCPLVEGLSSVGTELFVIGKYRPWYFVPGSFEGTDKLSMAVQPNLLTFIRGSPTANFIFEGDRLFTLSFLKEASRWASVRVIILSCNREDLAERHRGRGDAQGERFIKSRYTKVTNVANWLAGQKEVEWTVEKHEAEEDTGPIAERMWDVAIGN